MSYKKLRVIVSGGGTGGHIFPAISIADKLKELNPESEILFVGAEGKMEMEKVPAAGYKIVGLPVAGLQRKLSFKNILHDLGLPFKVMESMGKAGRVIKEFKPDIVVGVGGYASAPLLWKATSMKVPAGPENYRVRCMISANGSNVVRDLPLPAEGDEIDISSTVSSGLSPVMSAIFDDAEVSSVDADEDNLIAIGGDLEKATVSFSVTPVTYRSQRSDGNGGFVEQLYYEQPVSVQFLILDQRGQQRYAFEPLEEALVNTNTGVYSFTQEIPYKYTLSDGTIL